MLGFGFGITSAPHRRGQGFNPGDNSKTIAWWDRATTDLAGAIPASDGDLVATLPDQSGGGVDWSQPLEAARPELKISGGALYLENDGIDDRGLVLANDISAKEVCIAFQYQTGIESTFSSYPTLFTDLAGAAGSSAAQCRGSAGTAIIHDNEWLALTYGGAFSRTVLPLGWSAVFVKRSGASAFPFGAVAGPNGGNVSLQWPGKFFPIAAFSEELTDAERAEISAWAVQKFGVSS